MDLPSGGLMSLFPLGPTKRQRFSHCSEPRKRRDQRLFRHT